MAKSKDKKSNKVLSQLIGLVVVLVVLVAASTVTTLVATGTIEVAPEKGTPISYIGDAEQVCNQRVKQDQGSTLSSMSVDDHSSHFDEASGQYKLYYQLDLYRDAGKQSGVKLFYVNCTVSSRGIISRIEYLEHLDFKPKAIRREKGNAFGF